MAIVTSWHPAQPDGVGEWVGRVARYLHSAAKSINASKRRIVLHVGNVQDPTADAIRAVRKRNRSRHLVIVFLTRRWSKRAIKVAREHSDATVIILSGAASDIRTEGVQNLRCIEKRDAIDAIPELLRGYVS